MIDVHVIRYHSLSNPELFDRCINSLKHPLVSVHEIAGYKNPHFGKLRVEGFSKGSGEYVSFLDDDDYLEPGAIDRGLEVIGTADYLLSGYRIHGCLNKYGVIPEIVAPDLVFKRLPYIQGFKLVKRSVVEKCYELLNQFEVLEDCVLLALLSKYYQGVVVPDLLLNRTLHSSNATKSPRLKSTAKAAKLKILEILNE